MKRAIFLFSIFSVLGFSPFVGPRAGAASSSYVVAAEIPWATVNNLLKQFVDYVPLSLGQLWDLYQVGRVTIEPYGEAWRVTYIDDDGGATIAILEDNF